VRTLVEYGLHLPQMRAHDSLNEREAGARSRLQMGKAQDHEKEHSPTFEQPQDEPVELKRNS